MIIKDEKLSNVFNALSVGSASAITGYVGASITEAITNKFNFRDLGLSLNLISNISTVIYDLVRYYWGNSNKHIPAIVLGGAPIGTVLEEDYTLSNRSIKFRSDGGIFLAHQPDGSEKTLRIKCKAFGNNRYFFLIIIDSLFRYGNNLVVDNFIKTLNEGLTNATLDELTPITTDPWERIRKYDLDKGKDEYRLTFPVISRNKIYNNMYIETYSFTESIENGLNVINFTIFLRNFTPNILPMYKSVKNEEGYTLWYYHPDDDDNFTKRYRMLDSLVDIGLSVSMMFYRMSLFLSHNSIEETMAMRTIIELNNEVNGDNGFGDIIKANVDDLDEEDDLIGLSITNKEELMQID